MKRWLISALFTFFTLSALIVASVFIHQKKSVSGIKPANEPLICVKRRVIKKISNPPSEAKKVPSQEKKIPPAEVPVQTVPQTEEPVEQFDDAEEGEEESDFSSEEIAFGVEDVKAEESYKDYALKRIAAKKVYPLSARTKFQEGKVRVHAIIDTDGNLISAEIVSPCEYEILNDAALKAVQKASPFKKMKNGKRRLEMFFVMDFSLT